MENELESSELQPESLEKEHLRIGFNKGIEAALGELDYIRGHSLETPVEAMNHQEIGKSKALDQAREAIEKLKENTK